MGNKRLAKTDKSRAFRCRLRSRKPAKPPERGPIIQGFGKPAGSCPAGEIARSLPGFGPVLATSYAAKAVEFGSIDRRAAAALIGVAPLACDSGVMRGKRRCCGGRRAYATSCTWQPSMRESRVRLRRFTTG